MPTRRDVLPCHVSQARKKFRLRIQDGVSDEDFYSLILPEWFPPRRTSEPPLTQIRIGWTPQHDGSYTVPTVIALRFTSEGCRTLGEKDLPARSRASRQRLDHRGFGAGAARSTGWEHVSRSSNP